MSLLTSAVCNYVFV